MGESRAWPIDDIDGPLSREQVMDDGVPDAMKALGWFGMASFNDNDDSC
jgi:hypothetical protein